MPTLIIPRPVIVLLDIAYYRLDFPSLLQSFVWRFDDVEPKLPRVTGFLDHWRRNIRVPIANINMAVSAGDGWRKVDLELHS